MDKYCVIRFEDKNDYDGAKVYGYYPTEENARKAASDAYDENPGDAFDVCPINHGGSPDVGHTIVSFGWED